MPAGESSGELWAEPELTPMCTYLPAAKMGSLQEYHQPPEGPSSLFTDEGDPGLSLLSACFFCCPRPGEQGRENMNAHEHGGAYPGPFSTVVMNHTTTTLFSSLLPSFPLFWNLFSIADHKSYSSRCTLLNSHWSRLHLGWLNYSSASVFFCISVSCSTAIGRVPITLIDNGPDMSQ